MEIVIVVGVEAETVVARPVPVDVAVLPTPVCLWKLVKNSFTYFSHFSSYFGS